MSQVLIDTVELPASIREVFKTPKVVVRSHDEGVIIMPFIDITKYQGFTRGSGFTVEKLLEDRREDLAREDRRLGLV